MSADDPQVPEPTPISDTKRKMMEALQAKQKRQGEAHIDADPKAAQTHGPADHKRVFRRKSG